MFQDHFSKSSHKSNQTVEKLGSPQLQKVHNFIAPLLDDVAIDEPRNFSNKWEMHDMDKSDSVKAFACTLTVNLDALYPSGLNPFHLFVGPVS